VAAISYDSAAVLKNFADRRHITFPLLSDPDSKIIRAFGILNEEAPKDTFTYGIPHPGTFIVDRQGIVVTKYFEDNYRERDTASQVLVRQFGVRLGLAESRLETGHLKLTTWASNATASQGQLISLIVDAELKPRMHVYAPGVKGYIPIDWSLTPSKAGAAREPSYPPSKTLHLPVINEMAPVYEGKFRLVREVTIGTEADLKPLLKDGQDLVFEGSFRYQACDDRECYLPQTVPLRWTLRFQPLDRQRVPEAMQRKAPATAVR
jgi:hypothetical protein